MFDKSKLVGRGKEMYEMKRYIDELDAFRSKIVFITGEAGIGKTRFVNEFLSELNDVLILTSSCSYSTVAQPYFPIVDCFRKIDEEREEVQPTQSFMIGMVERETTATGSILLGFAEKSIDELIGMGEIEKNSLFERVTNKLSVLGKRKKTVLFIDDLQWADRSTLEMFQYIVRNIENTKVLIVGCYRLGEAGEIVGNEELSNVVNVTVNERNARVIVLNKFSLMDMKLLLRSMYGRADFNQEFIDTLYDVSGGNPFFVVEIMRNLYINIDTSDSRWPQKLDADNLRITGDITETIKSRIESLGEDVVKVLEYASSVGNEFSIELIAEAMEIDIYKLVEALQTLVKARIIEEYGDRYKFSYGLMREVIYDSTSRAKKRFLHKKIAQSLEKIHSQNLNEVAYSLASHYMNAGVPENALPYTLRAGNIAIQSSALEDAMKFYNMAINMIESIPDENERKKVKLQIFEKLGQIYHILGEWNKASEYYTQAIQTSDEMNVFSNQMKLARQFGDLLMDMGKTNEAFSYYETALDYAEVLRNDFAQGCAYRGMGHVYWKKGDFLNAMNYLIKALNKADENSLIKSLYIDIGNILSEKGDFYRSEGYYAKAMDIAMNIGDVYDLARVYNNLGELCNRREEWKRGIMYFEKARDISRSIGYKQLYAISTINCAESYAHAGDIGKAKKYCERAKAIMEKIRSGVGLAYVNACYGIVYRLEKNLDRSARYFEMSLKNIDSQLSILNARIHMEYGITLKEMGNTEVSREYLKKAMDIYNSMGMGYNVEKVERYMS